MSISTLSGYRDALTAGGQVIPFTSGAAATLGGRSYDFWTSMVPAGVAPTTAVAPTNATAGSFDVAVGGANPLRILGADFALGAAAGVGGAAIIADRLSHQGGLSAVVTTAQTTNLPTAALTRYTTGDGVMVGLTIYTQIGATGTTVTASYTNQAGTAGRTTTAVVLGGNGYREAGRLILLPLQDGDSGVRSVESVTVLATTATAGNFGVTLFKPLSAIPATPQGGNESVNLIQPTGFCGLLPEIVDNACLFPVVIPVTVTSNMSGRLIVSEV